MDKDIALLHEKIDFLMAQMEEQKKRQQAFEELKNDMVPIGNHMIKLTIDELAEIGSEFKMEDLLFLLKRVLRNTQLFLRGMDYLEAIMGLVEEGELLGKQVFSTSVEALDEMERKGYFAFATQGINMVDQIVTEFDEEDAKALSDNVVSIIKTVRNMTQPDIMNLANDAVDAIRDVPSPDKPPSTFSLLKEMGNPQVRVGMARMLNILKTLADEPKQ